MTNSGQFEEVCLCNSEIKTGWTTENGIPLCNICGKVDVKACVEMAGESWHASAELPKVPEGMALVPVTPTLKMIEAAIYHAMRETDEDKYRAIGMIRCVWDEMLAATKDQQCQS